MGAHRDEPGARLVARKLITNRHGGCSTAPYESFNLGDHVGDDPDAVARNRARLAQVLGLAPSHLVFMEQLHTPTVTVVSGPQPRPVPATDAVVSTQPGVALVVLTADCVPVLLSDERAGVIAAVHAGRLGARNGIVSATVAQMLALGATADDIHVLIGPAASGEKYEVPRAMAEDVEQHLPGSLCRTDKGTYGLDLRAGIVAQLHALKVRNVDVDPRCTIEEEDFFSYRREGTTGRQAAVVFLGPPRGVSLEKDPA